MTPTTPLQERAQQVRADELLSGDVLWLDETQAWHTVYVLPTQPVMVITPEGCVKSTNLHLVPNPRGPMSIATYTLPVGQMATIRPRLALALDGDA